MHSSSSVMMNPLFFTFDYDYATESWNLPRGSVPAQLKAQGVPHALWMHFWDYAQSVVERASVRVIMKKKLQTECDDNNLKMSKGQRQEREAEMLKLGEQTLRDFECLQRQAERLFPNSRAKVSKDAHNNVGPGKQFGLEIQLLHHSTSSAAEDIVHLHYDTKLGSWSLPRDVLPPKLADHGVPLADWTAIWDYGFGVNQRAKEREHLNELHERELQLCQKSLSYMNSTKIASVDQNAASNHNTTATHIRAKMDKLHRATEANANNTKKGWQELQRRATQRFEPYGIKAYLSRPDNDDQICCGLQFQCPKKTNNGIPGYPKPKSHQSTADQHNKKVPTSSIWLPISAISATPTNNSSSSTSSSHKREISPSSPIPSVWNFAKEHFKTSFDHSSLSCTPPPSPPPPPSSPSPPRSPSSTNTVLRPTTTTSTKRNTEKENAPPKPETLLRKTKGLWGQPVVLTYVHDEIPSRIEVTTPLSYNSYDSYDDEDEHGYVVPPAPSDPPSSIGSSSTLSIGISSYKDLFSSNSINNGNNNKKKTKRLRFGQNQMHEYENPYTKEDRKILWFTHEEREACRAKTKSLAQRVIDSRNSGGNHSNVVFMDNDDGEEVCWRGLEHAKKGNLSFRQETRRAFLVKVLEKQRLLRLDSFSTRRGAPVADPESELQQYAVRQSRHCLERAQKLAAQDAKEARAVYKESLRKSNLYKGSHNNNTKGISSSLSLSSKCSIQHNSHQSTSHHHNNHHDENSSYHQNDIFQDYCRQMHMASKARMQQAVV